MSKVIIMFYGKDKKPMEIYHVGNDVGFEEYTARIVELTKQKALFAVYNVSECLGDFS